MARQPNEPPPTTHMCVPVPEIKDHLMLPPARTEQAGGLQDGDLERSDGGVRVRGVREGALTQQKSLLLISCPVLGRPALISGFSGKEVARPGVASGIRPSARPTRRFVPRVLVVCSPPTKPRSRSRMSVASCSCHACGRILVRGGKGVVGTPTNAISSLFLGGVVFAWSHTRFPRRRCGRTAGLVI